MECEFGAEIESEILNSEASTDENEEVTTVSQKKFSEYTETDNENVCETRFLQPYSEPMDDRYETEIESDEEVLPYEIVHQSCESKTVKEKSGWLRKSRKVHIETPNFEESMVDFEKYCEKARVIDYLLNCSGEEKRKIALTLMSSQVDVEIECPVCYQSLNPENPASIFNHYKNCAAWTNIPKNFNTSSVLFMVNKPASESKNSSNFGYIWTTELSTYSHS